MCVSNYLTFSAVIVNKHLQYTLLLILIAY